MATALRPRPVLLADTDYYHRANITLTADTRTLANIIPADTRTLANIISADTRTLADRMPADKVPADS